MLTGTGVQRWRVDDDLGFDQSLLIDGNNRVRVRVKPCPPLVGEGARMVQSVELRTLRWR